MQEKKVQTSIWKNVLLVYAVLGFLTSVGIHLLTFQPDSTIGELPYVMFLHVAAIGAVFGLVFVMNQEKWDRQTFMREVLVRQVWPLVVLVLLMVYAVINFFGSIGQGGQADIRDGKYVLHYRGKVLRTYPNKAVYLEAKRNIARKTTRGFSGMWIFFFAATGVILIAQGFARQKLALDDKRAKELDTHPPARVKEDIEKRGDLAIPPGTNIPFKERMRRYTPWRSFSIIMVVQISIILILAIITKVAFFYFVAAFLSIAFVNYFFFRKKVVDFLQRVQIEGTTCHIEVYRYDQLERLSIPLSALRIAVEEERERNFMAFFLRIYQDGKLIVNQQCEIGFWKKERCEALAAALSPPA